MFADQAELLNRLVQRVCLLVDHHLDVPPHSSGLTSSRLRRVCSEVGHSRGLSSVHFRRCDSQHIAEEETPLCMELSSTDDKCRPVFVVDAEELNQE